MRSPLLQIQLLFFIVYGLGISFAALAGTPVAVIYPQVDKPYAKIFQTIISELRQQKDLDVVSYSLVENYDRNALKYWIAQNKAQALVVLGQRGVEAVKNLKINIPTVIGAVLYVSGMQHKIVSGISLTPDPDLLFERLKKLAPTISRIHVVYNPDRYQWLIDYAKTAAKKHQLEIIAKTAKDLPGAAPLYRELLAMSQTGRDAVWLLQDSSTVGNSSILPLVLKESWNKKLVVFSSNPSHVRRGILFSLYPDQDALGKSISKLLLQQISGNVKSTGLIPLGDLHAVVNLRTADHIKINVSNKLRQQFDMVFPKR